MTLRLWRRTDTTHTDVGTSCKLHTERPHDLGIEPRTFMLYTAPPIPSLHPSCFTIYCSVKLFLKHATWIKLPRWFSVSTVSSQGEGSGSKPGWFASSLVKSKDMHLRLMWVWEVVCLYVMKWWPAQDVAYPASSSACWDWLHLPVMLQGEAVQLMDGWYCYCIIIKGGHLLEL